MEPWMIIITVAFLVVLLLVFWPEREPKYCGACGTKLTETTEPNGYDAYTGKERFETRKRCEPCREKWDEGLDWE